MLYNISSLNTLLRIKLERLTLTNIQTVTNQQAKYLITTVKSFLLQILGSAFHHRSVLS
jgi:hypothetical protein